MALSGAFWRFLGGLRHRAPNSETTYNDRPKLCVPSSKTWTKRTRFRGLRPSESPCNRRPPSCRRALAPVKALAERLGAAVVLVSRATRNGIGDRASAQSPVDRVQRCQRYQRLQGRCECNLCLLSAIYVRGPDTSRTFSLRTVHEYREHCRLAVSAVLAVSCNLRARRTCIVRNRHARDNRDERNDRLDGTKGHALRGDKKASDA
jgi:hypothetical protein